MSDNSNTDFAALRSRIVPISDVLVKYGTITLKNGKTIVASNRDYMFDASPCKPLELLSQKLPFVTRALINDIVEEVIINEWYHSKDVAEAAAVSVNNAPSCSNEQNILLVKLTREFEQILDNKLDSFVKDIRAAVFEEFIPLLNNINEILQNLNENVNNFI